MCALHCTLAEIAGFFKCSEDTIERWCLRENKITFAEFYKKHSANGNISLRRMQFKAAEKGNVAMLIFLGKQYLGQKDNPDESDNAEVLERLTELLTAQAEAAKKDVQP